MSDSHDRPRFRRFGDFVLDTLTPELKTSAGGTVHLQPQPCRLLVLLTDRPGDVILREQIEQRLWNGDTFVDYEHAVNFSIRQIRTALGDDARSPRFVETVPRRGYRFIASVDELPEAPGPLAPPPPQEPRTLSRKVVAAAAGVLLALGAAVLWLDSRSETTLAVADPGNAFAVTTSVPEARESYLRGRYFWKRGSPADLEKALSYFESAAAADPLLAEAHGAIADTWVQLGNFGLRKAGEAFPKARESAARALQLKPENIDARLARGNVSFRYDWNWDAAERDLRSVVDAAPQSPSARHDYGWFLISMLRFDDGIAQLRQAHELDPLSLRANVDIGWAFLRAGRVDEAIGHLRRVSELAPEYSGTQQCLEAAWADKDMYPEALNAARQWMERTGRRPEALSPSANVTAEDGLKAVWRWRLEADKTKESITPSYRIASYHAMLGEPDEAMRWLKRAFEERDAHLVAVHVDEGFRNLRADPRFIELTRRIGLPLRGNR